MTPGISVIGHRGWPTRFPDNTLVGFLMAALVGDGVELDVRRSADGKLVLAHDETIGGLEVASTPWSVLSEVDLGGGVKPCLLDEAIGALPGTRVFIEVKNVPGRPGYEPDHRLALEAAERARPSDAIISFNWASVDVVRSHFPEVATGLDVAAFGDIDDAIRHSYDVGHVLVVPDVDLVVAYPQRLPADLEFAVWSSRRGDLMAGRLGELVSGGVSAIITDDPQATNDLLGALDVDQG